MCVYIYIYIYVHVYCLIGSIYTVCLYCLINSCVSELSLTGYVLKGFIKLVHDVNVLDEVLNVLGHVGGLERDAPGLRRHPPGRQ